MYVFSRLKNFLKRSGRFISERAVQTILDYPNIFRLTLESKMKLVTPLRGRKVIWVPIHSIPYFVPNLYLKETFGADEVHKSNIKSFFWDGNWDLKKLPLDKNYDEYSESYKSVFQIFAKGMHYTQSDEYVSKSEDIKRGIRSVRAGTVQELNIYFEMLLNLKGQIQNEGYKTQSDLGKDPFDEIGVFIGRDGSLIKAEDNFSGTHRFAIAKYLKLEKIPVCVLAVHRKWAGRNSNLVGRSANKLEEYVNSHLNG